MENQNNREYRQNQEGRWYYQETETLRGNTYTNYYLNRNLTENSDDGGYSSCSEEEYNNQNWR